VRALKQFQSSRAIFETEVIVINDSAMSIVAYLRRAGLKANTPETARQFIPIKRNVGLRFEDVLDGVMPADRITTAGRSRGATIVDYLNSRHSVHKNSFFGHPANHALPPDRACPDPLSTAPVRKTAEKDVEPASGEDKKALIERSIRRTARKYNLPEKLIENIIRAESDFRPEAVSPAGAQGLMQLMPSTARELGVTDPFDVAQNIDGGSRYIKQMLDRFDGDVRIALAAYNAGPGTVERFNRNVPYEETRNYVQRVLAGMAAAEDAAT
jgi:hypothetical protein